MAAAKRALAPFERGASGENPYAVQHDLQATMQQLVGIVRQESEMLEALERLKALRARAELAGIAGNREYNSGWHTALDLRNLMTVSEAVTRAGLERKESRGAHFREDYPVEGRRVQPVQLRDRARRRRLDEAHARARASSCRAELQQVIEENK